VLDVTGKVVVAGFWNSHVHFTPEAGFAGADTASGPGLADALRAMLTRWGFTTVFDTGSELANTLSLRRRIESGEVPGPRIFTTGGILFPPGAGNRPGMYLAATPADAVAHATELLDGGADAIKVYAQTFWDLKLKLTPEVLAAVVAEARRRNTQVFAHPTNSDGLRNSVAAGVDVLVHTTPQIGPWGPELVGRMKAGNIALIPTLTLWRFELARNNVPVEGIERFQQRGVAQLREYSTAGGPILFGTDVGYMTTFDTREEFVKMGEAGMTFSEILASLTTTPASRRGLASTSGRIAPGFDADLVVLASDPSRDPGAFAEVLYTIRGGRVIHQSGRQ
jgi:imidazolonepropionase-like amidohydrolase